MSSTHVYVRLVRRYTVRAAHDRAYARGLLDGHADDASSDAPITVLDLPRAIEHAIDVLDQQAPDMGEALHVAALGTFRRASSQADETAWLHHGLDTGYGWPSVLFEPTVTRLAVDLQVLVSALVGTEQAAQIEQLAAFYQAAACAEQVVIVGEV
jgi:hypothetical protein